jgi:acetyl esterase/lipase
VGGASAGGNLAAVMCQLGRDESLQPPLTGQYLCVPSLLPGTEIPDKWKSELRSRTESVLDQVLKMGPGGYSPVMDALK